MSNSGFCNISIGIFFYIPPLVFYKNRPYIAIEEIKPVYRWVK